MRILPPSHWRPSRRMGACLALLFLLFSYILMGLRASAPWTNVRLKLADGRRSLPGPEPRPA